MHLLRKLYRLSCRDRCLLVEATLVSAIAALTLMLMPFRWIAPWLGHHMATTPASQSAEDRRRARGIQRAIRITSRYAPWSSQCLAQAITATIMLRRRRMGGTVYLGIAKREDEGAIAHAWLRSGATIVTGENGRQDHAVISTFAFGRIELPTGSD